MASVLTPLRTAPPRPTLTGGLGSAHCDVCNELVLEYVTAGNDVVELQKWLTRFGSGDAAREVQDRLKRATARRSAGRARLVRHQHEHLS
jgi:hypothetical protein